MNTLGWRDSWFTTSASVLRESCSRKPGKQHAHARGRDRGQEQRGEHHSIPGALQRCIKQRCQKYHARGAHTSLTSSKTTASGKAPKSIKTQHAISGFCEGYGWVLRVNKRESIPIPDSGIGRLDGPQLAKVGECRTGYGCAHKSHLVNPVISC